MLEIVVVDDDSEALGLTEAQLERYFAGHNIADFSVKSFTSPNALLEQMKAGARADIYFLDIVMPEINGIGLGHAIRKFEPDAKLVFLTTSEEYGVASYDVRAVDYCLKPCTYEKICRALDRALVIKRDDKARCFLIKLTDGTYSLPHSEIVFVEYYDHRLIVHTHDGKKIESVSYREPFTTLVGSLLNEDNFLRISTSYVINMTHVVKLRSNEFEMYGGKKLVISRTYLDSRSAYINYILENNRV